MKKIKIYLVLSVMFCLIVTYKYFMLVNINKQLNYEIKDQKRISDSIKQSMFPIEVELNRYQITLEKMREQDSVCSMLFEVIMESETE
jgi:hypothetical protein